ncbi:tissue factor pathway inhibitor-like [Hyposmocoma kahamanoa]|uniref:tissue factor pathway inhibitor-like n=1 Tax=Hyposmocoma kahamanoa TaxID=1477025 RepID=UPI000E6D7698|nr:tissue factor pathway inhibitor-like [Hyposmocoma kahamanoa]
MKGSLILFVFIISISNIVKSSVIKECLKNILGECIQPLVKHHKVKTTPSIAANVNECNEYGKCVETTTKESLRGGMINYMLEGDNSTYDYKDMNWEVLCKIQPNGWNCGEKGYRYTFYYDIKLYGCKTAVIGVACEHNHNSFNTLADCTAMCKDDGEHAITHLKLPPAVFCRLQPDFGYCDGYYPSFYFDLTNRRCVGFSYSGCGGNANRFQTSQQCASVCKTQINFEPAA